VATSGSTQGFVVN